MKIRDIIRRLDKPNTHMVLSINNEEVAEIELAPEANCSRLLLSFLAQVGIDLSEKNILPNNLTDTSSLENLIISFSRRANRKGKSADQTNPNKKLVSAFLEKIMSQRNLIAHDIEQQNSEKSIAKIKNFLASFLEELSMNIGESLEFFSDSEGNVNEDKFGKTLQEISESIGIECLRLNNFSNSSREENVSNWRNKLESACQTNSNSFWNLSEISFYKSSLMKDFKKFKTTIEESLETLKDNINTENFFSVPQQEQQKWLRSLDKQIEENHSSILESFRTFECKLDSGTNSEAANTQMKIVGLPIGIDLEERSSHMTGFHFIEMINNQTAVKSKTSRRSDVMSFQPDSRESFHQISTKKKTKLNHKSMEDDVGKKFIRDLKEEMKGLHSKELLESPGVKSSRSESDSVMDKLMERETGKGFHKKMGFGFFMLQSEHANNCSSIYDSSMTHRLLDALLDDNVLSQKKTSIKNFEKMAFSKTTDPEKTGLKDLLSKIKKDMQKKMSIQDVDALQQTLPEIRKTFESIQSGLEENVSKQVSSQSANQVVDIYQDEASEISEGAEETSDVESLPTERIENFRSNTLDGGIGTKMNLFSARNPSMVKSSTISPGNNSQELSSLGESLQKRFRHNRFGSLMSQKSSKSGNENWRSRLGEKIGSVPQQSPASKFNRVQKIVIPEVDKMQITEESNELFENQVTFLKETISDKDTELLRSPELTKSIQKRLKNLIMRPDKEDKELLKQQLVRASKANKSISRSILSQNSSVEMASETIGLIVAGAKKNVLKKIRKQVMKQQEENYQSKHEEFTEKRIRDLSRRELEESLIRISNHLNYFGVRPEKVQEGIERFVKDALSSMKTEVETPFEDLVKQNIVRLEESKNYLDMMEMENIELEYGMLKLTQMYNEIIQTLEVNGITLEMPEDLEEQEESKPQVVKPFSLKDFREQIKNKVQEEKNELDRNLFEIQEDGGLEEEEIGGASCLQMKSVEINLEQEQEISENTLVSDVGMGMGQKKQIQIRENNSEILIKDFGKTSNQTSPTNSDFAGKFKDKRNSMMLLRSSDNPQSRRLSLMDKSGKFSKLVINEKKPFLMKSNGSLLIDFNKESNGFKSRRMIKTISGAIKTVDEMKEEYYNVKRFNVELLVENQELGTLNHRLNSENLKFGQDLSKVKKQVSELEEEKQKMQAQVDQGDKLREVQSDYEELLEQNKKLLEDSKGMTDFMLMNFLKVIEDLKESRDELDFVKREFSIEIQLLQRIVMKKLVPRLKEANNNCTLLCAVNDDYEKEKSEVGLKVNMIYELCSKMENEKMNPELTSARYNSEEGYNRIWDLCKEIFEIQDSNKSQDSDSYSLNRSEDQGLETPRTKEGGTAEAFNLNVYRTNEDSIKISDRRLKTNEDNRINTLITVPSKDYNKLIYSELSLESNHKLSRDRNKLIKPSIDRKTIVSSRSRGPPTPVESDATNESNEKYQINYDNSYMGQSSSNESSEFNNGMDVLLKEYMTDKMKKPKPEEEGTKPPYNTEKPDEININEYIMKTDESQLGKERDRELGLKEPEPTNREAAEAQEMGLSLEERNMNFHMSINTTGQVKEDIPEQRSPNESNSLSQNWTASKTNQIDDADLDRESGFEDIVEKLIGIVCLEDEDMRSNVCKIYNKMFSKNETQSMGTNDEMLRSLQESLNFKNKMIECLSESEKQQIATEALDIFKSKFSSTGKSIFLGVKSNYNSYKKKSKGVEGVDELTIKIDRLKDENKFLVSELERQNKLGKSMTSELETAKDELGKVKQKNEDLVEENTVLQQRLDLFDRENQTEMSEYNDEYNQYDMMSQRLSNNMGIIQEADEEYEIDSMMSGQDLQDTAQKILLQKFDPKMDHGSVDNESHYSFFKDYNKSDEEEGDFDTQNIGSMTELKPKMLKRRATESGRRLGDKDILNKYIDELGFNPSKAKKKKRKTIGNMGMSLVRKKLEKSVSYNVNAHSQKDELFDFDPVVNKHNKTSDEMTSKSQDFKKIQLRRLISEPISKSLSNNDKSGILNQSSEQLDKNTKQRTHNNSLGPSDQVNPSPMISFISQEKSTNNRFNFSKNFDDDVEENELINPINQESLEQFPDESATTYKRKNSAPQNFESILRELEIYHVMSFSSKESSISPNLVSRPNEAQPPITQSPETLDLSFAVKKPIMVESEVFIDMQSTLVNKNKNLHERMMRVKKMFMEKQLSEKLFQGVELIEMRLSDIDEKVKMISEMSRLNAADLEKYKSSEKGESVAKSRKPGFTSQFSSCRSIDQGRTPDLFESKSRLIESTQALREDEQKAPEDNNVKETANRVLFGNNNKRTSRFLLREFINKNFEPKSGSPQMLSPFEKKIPLNFEAVKEVEVEVSRGSGRKSQKEYTGLELENLRLKNQLDNIRERNKKLENDLEEGKKGLERLLESMPRKVKQSPLLKMGDKHFREILELVKFQVEEYKDRIKEFKEQTRTEFSLEEDSEGERTEELLGTSVMNSKNLSSKQSNIELEEQWTWEAKEEQNPEESNEISIKFLDTKGYEANKKVLKQSSTQFQWEDHNDEDFSEQTEEEAIEEEKEDRNILNIEIPETNFPGSQRSVSKEEDEQEEQITFEEMRRKQYVVQGPNSGEQAQGKGKEKQEELYESSGLKRGEMLIEKVERKRREIGEILESVEEGSVLNGLVDEIEAEIKAFILNLGKNDFESVGMNLYKQNSKKYSEDLQERLGEVEEKYQLLEREMIELRNENEEMRRTHEELGLSGEFENTGDLNFQPSTMERRIRKDTEERQDLEDTEERQDLEDTEERQEVSHKELEIQVHNEDSGEEAEEAEIDDTQTQDSRTERQKAMEDVDKEITGEINEMIFDLLEVIEDVNISTVEKMKVIRIFLHHTHDLLGTHEQMHFIEQSRDYNTGDGSNLMLQFPTNPTNPAESDQEDEDEDEETNLECWEEKLEAIPDGQEDYLSREVEMVEEKQLTEIKEDERSEEDYDSQDPKSQIMNQLDDGQARDFREERGYSSLEVLHDRAGEIEPHKDLQYDHENYESANIIRDLRKAGGERSRQNREREESLNEQIGQLEDEKVGLKNKNIMLSDKITFLNQKLALMETRLEEMENSYVSVKSEKKEFRARYEDKNKELQEVRGQLAETRDQMKFMESEMERINLEVEIKTNQMKNLLDKIENLQELNLQLVTENELRSQELIDYSLIRSSVNTGNTPIKNNSEHNGERANPKFLTPDSRISQGRNQSQNNKFDLSEQFFGQGKKNDRNSYGMRDMSPARLFGVKGGAHGQRPPKEEATDRSEFPKGFGVQQMHREEIIDQKNEINRLRNEKYELMSQMNNIQEDAKLNCFKYEEDVKELKLKLKKFKDKEVTGYRGSTWLKKRVSSCKVENELRKKNLKISKLTNQIQKLQGQVKSLTPDPHLMHGNRFSNNQRMSSNTESKNSLYQRE